MATEESTDHSYPLYENLYIIGNGFDRYHQLETSYQEFAFYLQDYHSDIHDLLTEYYGLPYLKLEVEEDHWDPLWSDFERTLADLDFEQVLEDNSEYQANPSAEDFRDRDWHSYQIEMEGIVNNLTQNLYEAFRGFILAVEFPELDPNLTLKLEPDAVYLTFNYTDTLERYYGIDADQILYLHGKALIKEDIIVLGHGIDPDTFKDKPVTPPEGLNEEQLEQWWEYQSDQHEYSYDSARAEIKSYFIDSHKATAEIIEKNQPFFTGLNGVKNVYVLGHSLADVDWPYFAEVALNIDLVHSNWILTYHREDERNARIEKLMQLGLEENQIHLIKMNNLHGDIPAGS
jgi:hypothetical protein